MATAKKTSEAKTDRKVETVRARGERVRAEALRRVGQAIVDAACAYERALPELTEAAGIKIKDVPGGRDEQMVGAVLTALGFAFRDGASGLLDVNDRQRLERLYSALLPHVDGRTNGEAIELAIGIIDEWADAHPHLRDGAPHSELPPPFKQLGAPQALVMELTDRVHRDFSTLRAADVEPLLARYIPSAPRKKRGRPSHRKSSVTPSGILCELNKLAGAPLGRLTVRSVDVAVERIRGKAKPVVE